MTALAVDTLAAVRAAGGDVKVVGERLKVTAPTPLPDDLVERLRAAKLELLALLSSTTNVIMQSVAEERATSVAELVAPSPWFERVVPPAEREPGYEMPCTARRGRVEERGGVLLRFCAQCGRWATFGFGVNLRAGQLGRWYCREHRPQN